LKQRKTKESSRHNKEEVKKDLIPKNGIEYSPCGQGKVAKATEAVKKDLKKIRLELRKGWKCTEDTTKYFNASLHI
jgi:hypothetical protein